MGTMRNFKTTKSV